MALGVGVVRGLVVVVVLLRLVAVVGWLMREAVVDAGSWPSGR